MASKCNLDPPQGSAAGESCAGVNDLCQQGPEGLPLVFWIIKICTISGETSAAMR